MDKERDLKKEREKNLPKGDFGTLDKQTVNGGIGDGINDGGPAYSIKMTK
jgi:hypothetical protein